MQNENQELFTKENRFILLQNTTYTFSEDDQHLSLSLALATQITC